MVWVAPSKKSSPDVRNPLKLTPLEKASSLTPLLEVAKEDIKGSDAHGVSTPNHESLTSSHSDILAV